MPVKVSILLPNLNNRQYLERRMESIRRQTLSDWELIVVDSYSQDGAWEFFRECARRDKRIRIYQNRERGIYVNFNKCIEYARGEYVYFATSDDTMAATALETMAAALDKHPDCDLAHCKLRIIDEKDREVDFKRAWDNFYIVRYFGDWINKPHIRRAPHDGVLHFCGTTVYTSLTQLLIRRSLFDRIGLFLTGFGSIADFEWVMRATLTTDTVHVPEYLADWRLHGGQATAGDALKRAKAGGQFLKMAGFALKAARKIKPDLIKPLNKKELEYILQKEKFYYKIKLAVCHFFRMLSILKELFSNPRLVWELNRARKEGKNFVSQEGFLAYIKEMIKKHDLEKSLVKVGSRR